MRTEVLGKRISAQNRSGVGSIRLSSTYHQHTSTVPRSQEKSWPILKCDQALSPVRRIDYHPLLIVYNPDTIQVQCLLKVVRCQDAFAFHSLSFLLTSIAEPKNKEPISLNTLILPIGVVNHVGDRHSGSSILITPNWKFSFNTSA